MINSHALLFMLGGIFMTHEQFEKAADYWKNKGITAMPKEELKKAVEEYIAANNTCALATGTGDYVRFSINMMDLEGLRAYRLWEKPN